MISCCRAGATVQATSLPTAAAGSDLPPQPAAAFDRDREFARLAEVFRRHVDLPRLYVLAGLNR